MDDDRYYMIGVDGEIVCIMASNTRQALNKAKELFGHFFFHGEIPEDDAFWLECDIYG